MDMKANITMPRILCNGNGVLPHLQMGVAVLEFDEDIFSAPFGIFYVKTEI